MTEEQLILVVEDDPVVRLVTRKQLTQLGISSKAVASGEQALECLPDDIILIFMDIGLPGIDGMQTTQHIRARENQNSWKRIPIIALTAHSDKERCLKAGMDDFLQKPVLLKDLEQILGKWLPK